MTNQTTHDSDAYVPPGAAARIAFVTTKTLIRMAERGDIRSFTLPSGHRRYHREDLEAIAAGEIPTGPKSVAS
ncbi:hypothetical protein [Brevibacterium sp. K72]|uniref:hypothetical protein n=1 Tax=Brevibacterium sp. K72 TaxID=3390729 RepID=UPI003D2FCB1B